MKKMQKSQKILEEFSEELKSDNSEIMDVDDENGDEPHSSTMISQAKSAEPADDDDIDEELLSAANCSNIEIDKVRKSINRLLNVHVPLDLNQCVKDDDEHDDGLRVSGTERDFNDNTLLLVCLLFVFCF